MRKVFNFLLVAVASILQFGKNGGFLSWASSVFSFKQPNGTDLACIKIGNATQPDEAVTLAQLQAKGSIIVSTIFNGATPPTATQGLVHLCTVAGGVYVKGKLYIGDGTTLSELTLSDGQPITFATAQTVPTGIVKNNTTTIAQDHVYIFDVTDGLFFDNGAVASPYDESGVTKKKSFTISANGTVTGAPTIPAGAKVSKVKAMVTTAFNGTFNAGWAVALSAANLFLLADIDPTVTGSYSSDDLWETAASDTAISVSNNTITGGTVGAMTVIVEYVM